MNNHLGHFFFFFEKRQYPWKRRSPGLQGKTSASLEKRRSSGVPLKTSIREYIDSQRYRIPGNTLPVHINHCKNELEKNKYVFIY